MESYQAIESWGTHHPVTVAIVSIALTLIIAEYGRAFVAVIKERGISRSSNWITKTRLFAAVRRYRTLNQVKGNAYELLVLLGLRASGMTLFLFAAYMFGDLARFDPIFIRHQLENGANSDWIARRLLAYSAMEVISLYAALTLNFRIFKWLAELTLYNGSLHRIRATVHRLGRQLGKDDVWLDQLLEGSSDTVKWNETIPE